MNGPNTAPVYKFLKYHGSGFMGSRIKWNFTKFLVNKEGKVIARYGPTTTPFSIEVCQLPFLFFATLGFLLMCSTHSPMSLTS